MADGGDKSGGADPTGGAQIGEATAQPSGEESKKAAKEARQQQIYQMGQLKAAAAQAAAEVERLAKQFATGSDEAWKLS